MASGTIIMYMYIMYILNMSNQEIDEKRNRNMEIKMFPTLEC